MHNFGELLSDEHAAITYIEHKYGADAHVRKAFLEDACLFQWDRFLSWKDFESRTLGFNNLTRENVGVFLVTEMDTGSAGSAVMRAMMPPSNSNDCRIAFGSTMQCGELDLEALLLMRVKDMSGIAFMKTLKQKTKTGFSLSGEWLVVAIKGPCLVGGAAPAGPLLAAVPMASSVVPTNGAAALYGAAGGGYNRGTSNGGGAFYSATNVGRTRAPCRRWPNCDFGDSCYYEHGPGMCSIEAHVEQDCLFVCLFSCFNLSIRGDGGPPRAGCSGSELRSWQQQ
jgi:hypothetical protein